MSIIAVTGECTTTTAVALASAWPIGDDVLLVEADPGGGDLAAWFDMPVAPSLSTVVTRVQAGSWSEIEQLTRLSDAGVRVIPAPARAVEAAQAVRESARSLTATLATIRSPITIADAGDAWGPPSDHPFVAAADVVVVVHRQATQSARAAAVRLQRLADRVATLAASPSTVVVAMVGAAPFDPGEIETFLADASGAAATPTLVGLPPDDVSAAVLGGRTGVSARRLARLPLMRAARDLAAVCERSVADLTDAPWTVSR